MRTFDIMKSKRIFRIALFGLSVTERQRIRAISTLSKDSSRTYVLLNEAGSDAADFVIVDGDDPQALAQWQVFETSHPMVPAIMVGNGARSRLAEFQIRRPLMATLLFSVLKQMHVSRERPAFTPGSGPVQPLRPSPAKQQAPTNTRTTTKRALVVDDSLPIRRQMEIELQQFLGDTDLAETGEQAMELLSNKRYDVVFLDVVLPGVDGYHICKKIKCDTRLKNTPVIMLTGKSSPFDRVRGRLAGCNTYLAKPVSQAKFHEVMESLNNQPPTSGKLSTPFSSRLLSG